MYIDFRAALVHAHRVHAHRAIRADPHAIAFVPGKVYSYVYTWRCLCLQSKLACGSFASRLPGSLESDMPVAVTRRGETLGVYVPTPRKSVKSADMTELRAAADRLAAALSDVDEEEIVAEFKQTRRAKKAAGR